VNSLYWLKINELVEYELFSVTRYKLDLSVFSPIAGSARHLSVVTLARQTYLFDMHHFITGIFLYFHFLGLIV